MYKIKTWWMQYIFSDDAANRSRPLEVIPTAARLLVFHLFNCLLPRFLHWHLVAAYI